eukprot:8570007-Lingulodinium_polyedra.AAC.1
MVRCRADSCAWLKRKRRPLCVSHGAPSVARSSLHSGMKEALATAKSMRRPDVMHVALVSCGTSTVPPTSANQ